MTEPQRCVIHLLISSRPCPLLGVLPGLRLCRQDAGQASAVAWPEHGAHPRGGGDITARGLTAWVPVSLGQARSSRHPLLLASRCTRVRAIEGAK